MGTQTLVPFATAIGLVALGYFIWPRYLVPLAFVATGLTVYGLKNDL
jgi:fatty acid desaturase